MSRTLTNRFVASFRHALGGLTRNSGGGDRPSNRLAADSVPDTGSASGGGSRGGSELFGVGALVLAVGFMASPAAFADISGTAFRDFNGNGSQDAGEPGIVGVIVEAVDAAGNTSSTTSGTDGLYTLLPALMTGTIRVEFMLPGSLDHLQPGASGGTSVQFVGTTDTGVDVGFLNPAQYAPATAELVTTITFMGDSQSDIYTAKGLDAIVGVDYDVTATSGANIPLADVEDVGATWGVAYQRSSKSIFAAATMKRHSAFGPLGTGGIYAVDRDNPGTVVEWVNLADLSVDTGADTRDGIQPNALPSDAASPSWDTDAFTQVAKVGIGDIDMDEDDQTMWIVNLHDQSLYGIKNVDIDNPPVNGDGNLLGPYAMLADITCPFGELRPWGVTAHEGKVYVGAVCSGEYAGATRGDLTGHVLEFDPSSPGSGFTDVVSIDFGEAAYVHQLSGSELGDGVGQNGDGWQTWNQVESFSSYAEVTNYGGTKARYAVPLISDIEFDSDGNMVIGVMSRWGLMQGQGNYWADPAGSDMSIVSEVVAAGDTLRACLQPDGAFDLETNAECGVITTSGTNNTAGPGGGEYYYQDNGPPNDSNLFLEQSMGAMAIRPGDGDVVVTVYDPLAYNSNGLEWWNDSTGGLSRASYQLYESASAPLYGKGNGMGDIEVMADPAPIEIGNRVWFDADGNGIQDGDESPIAGVVIGLYDNADVLVDTVTTDSDGTYIFSSDPTGTDSTGRNYGLNIDAYGIYAIAVLDSNFDSGGVLFGYSRTAANAENDTSNDALLDVRDSDGLTVAVGSGGNAAAFGVSVTLSGAGNNNHGLDFGVNDLAPDLQIIKTASPNPVAVGGQLTYTLTVTNNGPGTATDIVVTDTLISGVSWVSTTTSSGTCDSGDLLTCACSDPDGPDLSCNIGSLDNGDSADVIVIVTVN